MPLDAYKIAQARAQFADLLNRAKAGEEILITRGRKPQARIVPPPEAVRREPAPLAHLRLPDDLFDGEDPEQAAIDAGKYGGDEGIRRGQAAAP